MTEEVKLKKRIAQQIIVATMESDEAVEREKRTGEEVIKDYQTWALIYADRILTLFREAGWKSPEECQDYDDYIDGLLV